MTNKHKVLKKAFLSSHFLASSSQRTEVNTYHEMFSTEDQPKTEKHGIKDTLTYVTNQHHIRHVERKRQKLDRNWKSCKAKGTLRLLYCLIKILIQRVITKTRSAIVLGVSIYQLTINKSMTQMKQKRLEKVFKLRS